MELYNKLQFKGASSHKQQLLWVGNPVLEIKEKWSSLTDDVNLGVPRHDLVLIKGKVNAKVVSDVYSQTSYSTGVLRSMKNVVWKALHSSPSVKKDSYINDIHFHSDPASASTNTGNMVIYYCFHFICYCLLLFSKHKNPSRNSK